MVCVPIHPVLGTQTFNVQPHKESPLLVEFHDMRADHTAEGGPERLNQLFSRLSGEAVSVPVYFYVCVCRGGGGARWTRAPPSSRLNRLKRLNKKIILERKGEKEIAQNKLSTIAFGPKARS